MTACPELINRMTSTLHKAAFYAVVLLERKDCGGSSASKCQTLICMTRTDFKNSKRTIQSHIIGVYQKFLVRSREANFHIAMSSLVEYTSCIICSDMQILL